MNNGLLQEWVTALRSGAYAQTKGVLSREETDGTRAHCCLGVLCELAVKRGVIDPAVKSETDWDNAFRYGKSICAPPKAVWNALGLEEERDLRVEMPEHIDLAKLDEPELDEEVSVILLNDALDCSFKEIADAIERTFLADAG